MVFTTPRVKNCNSYTVASVAIFRHCRVVSTIIGDLQYHNVHTKSRGSEAEMWDKQTTSLSEQSTFTF